MHMPILEWTFLPYPIFMIWNKLAFGFTIFNDKFHLAIWIKFHNSSLRMTILPLSFDCKPFSILYVFPSAIWFSIFHLSIVESSAMFILIVGELPFYLLEETWIHMWLKLSIEHFHFFLKFLNLVMEIIIVVDCCTDFSYRHLFSFNLRHLNLHKWHTHCFYGRCLFSAFTEGLMPFFKWKYSFF